METPNNNNNNNDNKKNTVRSRSRTDFKVKQTLWTNIACGVLALITTLLIWLFAG